MDINLTGKYALVCGSSQGIGKAIAIELAHLGASVTLFARNREALNEVLAELDRSKGQQHQILVADFSQSEQVKEAVSPYGRGEMKAHIVINNTGGPAAGLAIDADPASFLAGFQAHIICGQHLVQATVPFMKEEGYGRIINIISTSVKAPLPNLGVSNTIRGAVANWGKTLAMELGPFGITVNNVLPGLTETARLSSLIDGQAKQSQRTADAQAEVLKLTVPARRFGKPEETAAAVAFLASPAAAYINGINLPVDGGRTPSL